MNTKLALGILALSFGALNTNINAIKADFYIEKFIEKNEERSYTKADLKKIQNIAASIAFIPTVQKFCLQQDPETNLIWLGNLANYIYNITSTAIEGGSHLMDIKILLDAFNTAKIKSHGTADSIKDPAIALAEAATNLYAQKAMAGAIGKALPSDSHRIFRRILRILLCSCVEATVHTASSAAQNNFKSYNLIDIAHESFVKALSANIPNEIAGEIIVSNAENVNDGLADAINEIISLFKDASNTVIHS